MWGDRTAEVRTNRKETMGEVANETYSRLADAIEAGDEDAASELAQAALDEGNEPADIIRSMSLGVRRAGERFNAAVQAAILASNGDPRFMVAPGCELTSDTPVENVKAFVHAASTYAAARPP